MSNILDIRLHFETFILFEKYNRR